MFSTSQHKPTDFISIASHRALSRSVRRSQQNPEQTSASTSCTNNATLSYAKRDNHWRIQRNTFCQTRL